MPKAPKLFLRYQGVFDFEALYTHMSSFFRKRQYDYSESNWKEKDATPQGREITVKMKPQKNVTEYIQHKYTIEWKCVDAHPVSVERRGKTVELTSARFHLHIQAELVVDWQGFEQEASVIGNFFNKYVFKQERDKVYMNALMQEMQEFLDSVKKELGMHIARRQ